MLIDDYFQQIESLIAEHINLVESSLIKDKRSTHIGIIEGVLSFRNDSVLNFIEFVNVKEAVLIYKYSYHYQDPHGKLIFRYDMAPHHREVDTFPHHKHILPNKVVSSSPPDLAQVLDEIDDIIEQSL